MKNAFTFPVILPPTGFAALNAGISELFTQCQPLVCIKKQTQVIQIEDGNKTVACLTGSLKSGAMSAKPDGILLFIKAE